MSNLFDKKDVFSWSNAEEAKEYIGKNCYFGDCLEDLKMKAKNNTFCPLKAVFSFANNVNLVFRNSVFEDFGLCLPCDKVKKALKYRPFKDLNELVKYLTDMDNIDYLIGYRLMFRHKKHRDETVKVIITALNYKYNKIYLLNDFSDLEELFNGYEFWNGEDWMPFGVLDNK